MLVSFALGDANFLRRPCTFHFFCVDFFALGSKRKPNSQWNIGGVGCLALGLCVGHVHFIFFVLISFASGTQRKPVFLWNMGFTVLGMFLFLLQNIKEFVFRLFHVHQSRSRCLGLLTRGPQCRMSN